ncbi:MAG: hypothetical protein MRZ79_12780 [Bacteroidia bacterium]|nr:hypothetical protein [Bacteroidia bacterium]
MKDPKNPELIPFAPILADITQELETLLKNIKSKENKKGIQSVKKLIEKL